jgi:hypothetical protein
MNTTNPSDPTVENNFVLSHRDAIAASPDDMAVCGEEDPGEGLEFLISDDTKNV